MRWVRFPHAQPITLQLMKHNNIILLCGVAGFFAGSFIPRGGYPDDYIAIYADDRKKDLDRVINTDEIVYIVPLDERAGGTFGKHLEVYLSDMSMIRVYEDLDEFLDRARNSRR